MNKLVLFLQRTGLPALPIVYLLVAVSATLLHSQDKDLVKQLNQVTSDLADDSTDNTKYRLAYRMAAGENIRSRVVHLVSMDTKIEGEFENLKSRCVSTRLFRIAAVDNDGNMTLVHLIENAELWQKVTGKDEIRYDSQRDQIVPENYVNVAASIGKPLSTITISPAGKIIRRQDEVRQFNPGIGLLLPQLPERSVAVGQRWFSPEKIRIRTQNGRVQTIQLRKLYRLEKVTNGLAKISVRTQVLTPVNDPKIQSQLMQRMQHGTVEFDLDAGRIYSSRMELDERVIGFSGAASMIHYLSRMTETLVMPGSPEGDDPS